jgi:hypothetical protein
MMTPTRQDRAFLRRIAWETAMRAAFWQMHVRQCREEGRSVVECFCAMCKQRREAKQCAKPAA